MQLALLPLALEQRGVDEAVTLVVVDVLDDDRQRLVGGRPVDPDHVAVLAHARRARHVVDRLRALERVHRDRAVLLEEHDAVARGEAGREPAGVADRAAADENAHRTDGIPCGRVRDSALQQRNAPPDGPAVGGPVDLRDGHVRGRLALRERRHRRHLALRRAPLLQGHRAPSDGARHRHRDGWHRRRVQRLHGQGVHRLLRQVREGARARRDRRARRHAPALALRRRGDRAREGRDHRGDEHVPRHADELPAGCLRPPLLRRHAARPRHHRHQGDGRRGHPRDVHEPPRPLVRPVAHGDRPRRRRHRHRQGARRGPLRHAAGGRQRRSGAVDAPSRIRASASTRRSRTRSTSASAAPDCRSCTPIATRPPCSPPCSAAACRRASSPRCASAAAWRTTSGRSTASTSRPGRSSRRPASISSAPTRP